MDSNSCNIVPMAFLKFLWLFVHEGWARPFNASWLTLTEFKLKCKNTSRVNDHKCTTPWCVRWSGLRKRQVRTLSTLVFVQIRVTDPDGAVFLLKTIATHLTGQGSAKSCSNIPVLQLIRLAHSVYSHTRSQRKIQCGRKPNAELFLFILQGDFTLAVVTLNWSFIHLFIYWSTGLGPRNFLITVLWTTFNNLYAHFVFPQRSQLSSSAMLLPIFRCLLVLFEEVNLGLETIDGKFLFFLSMWLT